MVFASVHFLLIKEKVKRGGKTFKRKAVCRNTPLFFKGRATFISFWPFSYKHFYKRFGMLLVFFRQTSFV